MLVLLLLFVCLLLSPQVSCQVPSCHQLRASFQLLHSGLRWAPETPVSGTDLQVCQSKSLTCCSRKMEERYQVVARQNMESGLQVSSAPLKLLIIQNAALFQEAFEMVLRHARNSTLLMLRTEFPTLGGGAISAVGQLFLDISLYILGSDGSVDDMVATFFGRLFPLTYQRLLLAGGMRSAHQEECLRDAWGPTGAFGAYPKMMMTSLSRALPPARAFLQALNLGIEVVNTTQHLRPGRECSRALLRLWLCPRCLGLPPAPPCPTLCPSLMQGCLSGVGLVQPHWTAYVEGLAVLVGAMQGERDAEEVLLRLHVLVRLALRHSFTTQSRLHSMVSSLCSHSSGRVIRSATHTDTHASATLEPRRHQTGRVSDMEETLAGRRREFIFNLKGFINFYGGLGEALCSREPSAVNGSHCWNGHEIADRAGPKRVSHSSPETKNKVPEPVVSQIIDKLKHINQLLRQVTVPVRRWRARPGGGGVHRHGAEEDAEPQSGDCDDEDECSAASGMGLPTRRKGLRIFADLSDHLAMDDFTFHEQLLTPRFNTDAGSGSPLPALAWCRRSLGLHLTASLAGLALLLGFP